MNTKEELVKIIKNDFYKRKILVIGDLMVDEYVTGKVGRISPEAPVPVLDYEEKKRQAGGACNVANNLSSLGAKVYISGVASNDSAGVWLRDYLDQLNIDTSCIADEEERPTTLKTRYAVKGQQLLRVDTEERKCISKATQDRIFRYIQELIEEIDAVILSDYSKGVLGNPEFVKKIIALCNENKVIVTIDSKSKNIYAFENANFVKPNNLELEEAVGIIIKDEDSFNLAGEKYLTMSGAKALIVTRGSKGISVFEPGKKREDYPARNVQVFDVCGAGDTVISTFTMCICSGFLIGEAVKLANLAAGVVISRVGTAKVTNKELIDSIYEK